MTKKELVKHIAEKFNISKLQARELVHETFEAIMAALIVEGRVELRNFGVFEIYHRKERIARNPRNNLPVVVKAKNVVSFQPGKELETKVMENPLPKIKPRNNSQQAQAKISNNGQCHVPHGTNSDATQLNGFNQDDATLNVEEVLTDGEQLHDLPMKRKPR